MNQSHKKSARVIGMYVGIKNSKKKIHNSAIRFNEVRITVREKSKRRMLEHYRWYQQKNKSSKRSERIRRKLKLPPGDLRIRINEGLEKKRKLERNKVMKTNETWETGSYDYWCEMLWKMSGRDMSLTYPFVNKSKTTQSMICTNVETFTRNDSLEIQIQNETTEKGVISKNALFSEGELQKLKEETKINICYKQPPNEDIGESSRPKYGNETPDSLLRNKTEQDKRLSDKSVLRQEQNSIRISTIGGKVCLGKEKKNHHITVPEEEEELYTFLQNIKIESDDSFDELVGIKHPNRRLQLERKCTKKRISHQMKVARPELVIKPSEMWIDVIKTPDLWRKEKPPFGGSYSNLGPMTKKLKQDLVGSEGLLDYNEMLLEFIDSKLIEENGKTLYEQRYQEELLSSKSKMFFKHFYISPARVEVFHHQLTDQLTAIESLRQVCLTLGWPEPRYQSVSDSSGAITGSPSLVVEYRYSVSVKDVHITPTKPAVEESLARELAACSALHLLGLEQRAINMSPICNPLLTYSSYFGPNK